MDVNHILNLLTAMPDFVGEDHWSDD